MVCLADGGVCPGVAGNFISVGGGAAPLGNVYTLAGKQAATNAAASTNTSNYGFSGDGGPANAAELNYPVGVAIDSFDNVVIADQNNARVRAVCFTRGSGVCSAFGGDASNGRIHTIAGGGGGGTCVATNSATGIGCAASGASLKLPVGVAVDPNNNVAIADAGQFRVLLICTGTSGLCSGGSDAFGNLQLAAGSGISSGFIYSATGTGINAGFGPAPGAASASGVSSGLWGVGFDSAGNLFSSDPGNTVISVTCAGATPLTVCAHVNGGTVEPNGNPGGNATAFNVYGLSDVGSGSDLTVVANGAMAAAKNQNTPFNFSTHAVGFMPVANTIIVSDRNNNAVRFMSY